MVLTNTLAMFISKNFTLAFGVCIIGFITTFGLAWIGYSIIKK
ncbi:MAG: hypothetical protein ACI4T9_08955 [Prevotella sp.]